jgi:uncharacterized membrane protein
MGEFFPKYFFILFVSGFFLAGCNMREDKNQISPLTSGKFAVIQQKIISPKCVTCHSGPSAADGIDLSSYSLIMQSRAVVPHDPEKSSFYLSVAAGRMPKGRERLSQEDQDLIFSWIKDGAKESELQGPSSAQPTFTWISKNILEPKCIVCHNSAKPRGKTDLSSYEALISSEGRKHKPVVSGDAQVSGLYLEVAEHKMPPTPKSLTSQEIDSLSTWITNGALEITPGSPPPSPPGVAPGPPQPTYEWLSKNLLSRRCGNCHGIPFKVANIDFTSYATLMDSKGITMRAVVANSPSQSGIYREILTGHMPPPRKEVSAEETKVIHEWIQSGALKN